MHLAEIHIYPVKSLRGISLQSAAVDELGLVGDRRFLVVDSEGKFLTQRTHPKMALIDAVLEPETLELSFQGSAKLSIPRQADAHAPRLRVSVWRSEGLLSEDCGDKASRWLGDFLGLHCRLMRIGHDFHRPIPEKKLPSKLVATHQTVSFADAYPFLIIGDSSLIDLNTRLQASGSPALPMNRFRPNLVVSGAPAFAEDGWKRFRIGEVVFQAGGGCARCVMTTTDQSTAERGIEPLRTLAGYRRDPEKPTDVLFGQNLIHETKSGTLRVGDRVEVLEE